MAVSRGHAAAAGEIVLCTGAGIETVQVDADGNPTQGGHYCPDCVLVAWTADDAHFALVLQRTASKCDAAVVANSQTTQPGPLGFGARGPPVVS